MSDDRLEHVVVDGHIGSGWPAKSAIQPHNGATMPFIIVDDAVSAVREPIEHVFGYTSDILF